MTQRSDTKKRHREVTQEKIVGIVGDQEGEEVIATNQIPGTHDPCCTSCLACCVACWTKSAISILFLMAVVCSGRGETNGNACRQAASIMLAFCLGDHHRAVGGRQTQMQCPATRDQRPCQAVEYRSRAAAKRGQAGRVRSRPRSRRKIADIVLSSWSAICHLGGTMQRRRCKGVKAARAAGEEASQIGCASDGKWPAGASKMTMTLFAAATRAKRRACTAGLYRHSQ